MSHLTPPVFHPAGYIQITIYISFSYIILINLAPDLLYFHLEGATLQARTTAGASAFRCSLTLRHDGTT